MRRRPRSPPPPLEDFLCWESREVLEPRSYYCLCTRDVTDLVGGGAPVMQERKPGESGRDLGQGQVVTRAGVGLGVRSGRSHSGLHHLLPRLGSELGPESVCPCSSHSGLPPAPRPPGPCPTEPLGGSAHLSSPPQPPPLQAYLSLAGLYPLSENCSADCVSGTTSGTRLDSAPRAVGICSIFQAQRAWVVSPMGPRASIR